MCWCPNRTIHKHIDTHTLALCEYVIHSLLGVSLSPSFACSLAPSHFRFTCVCVRASSCIFSVCLYPFSVPYEFERHFRVQGCNCSNMKNGDFFVQNRCTHTYVPPIQAKSIVNSCWDFFALVKFSSRNCSMENLPTFSAYWKNEIPFDLDSNELAIKQNLRTENTTATGKSNDITKIWNWRVTNWTEPRTVNMVAALEIWMW